MKLANAIKINQSKTVDIYQSTQAAGRPAVSETSTEKRERRWASAVAIEGVMSLQESMLPGVFQEAAAPQVGCCSGARYKGRYGKRT